MIDVIARISPSGRYLVVPPGWDGAAPEDCVVARPATYVSWLALRGNVEQTEHGPDTAAAVELMRTQLKIYPLSASNDLSGLPPMEYHNVSAQPVNRLAPEGLEFFYALAEQVAGEAPEQTDTFAMGLMRSIGVAPDLTFAPDKRMQTYFDRSWKPDDLVRVRS